LTVRTTLAFVLALSLIQMAVSPAHAALTQRNYPATIDGYAVVNPATLAVRFTIKNDGTRLVDPSCIIRAQDESGTYHGFDVFVPPKAIQPGSVVHLVGNLTITKQGAAYVTTVKINCTALTADKATSAGKSVRIVDVNNCGDTYGAFDPSSGWYWGACIKVGGVNPNTILKCTETALNGSGKAIAKHSFVAVTFSNLTLTGYGTGQTTMPDTTKAIAEAIKTVKVVCALK
jgi:hypothetical protein